jgi:hypothetical protein
VQIRAFKHAMSGGFLTEIITMDRERGTGLPGLLHQNWSRDSNSKSGCGWAADSAISGRRSAKWVWSWRDVSACTAGRSSPIARAPCIFGPKLTYTGHPSFERFRRQGRNPGLACPAGQRPKARNVGSRLHRKVRGLVQTGSAKTAPRCPAV